MKACRFDRALAVVLALGFVAASVPAAEVPLDNGVVGDGHLNVTVDDYGSFADAFGGGPSWLDVFDPSPDPILGNIDCAGCFATFSTHLFFFVDPSTDGGGTHRGPLSAHGGIVSTYDDGNLTCEVTQENSVTGLPFATDSVFTCTGPFGFEFEVTLNQTVGNLDPGPEGEARALLDQVYSIRNTSTTATELIIVKHIDEDMPWGTGMAPGYHTDDLVGADFAELDRPQVFAQDGDLTTAALVLRTRDNHDPALSPVVPNSVDFIYYAGKQGLTANPNPDYPGGECPMYDYGTDFQIWDNYGAPNCWKNNVPGVGHDVAGISPQVTGDSHIGLQVEAAIAPGATYEVSFQTIYGFRPPPTLQIPPPLITQTIQYDTATQCGEFFWSITNNNPIVPGEEFVLIDTFYLDIEAGDGGNGACVNMTPPDGWTVELCASDANGHSLYRFTGGTPLGQNDTAHGRLTIDTNGLDPTVNIITGAEVPPLSVLIHAAQEQIDPDTNLPYPCDFNFGPEREGGWSGQAIATAHLPVPSTSTWAKTVLASMILGAGALLVLRSRRTVVV